MVALRRHGEYVEYSSEHCGRRGQGVLKHGKASNEETLELNEVKISCKDPFVNRVFMSITLRAQIGRAHV